MILPKLFLFFLLITSIFTLASEVNDIKLVDIDEFNVNYSEEDCKKVKDIFKNIFKQIYVYNDISKDPPNETYYGIVNLTEEFDKIPTSNRKYLDFYRDIKKVIGKVKDLHFYFSAKNYTNNDIHINEIYACLPISIYVKGNTSDDAEMYIRAFNYCSFNTNEDIKQFINEHINISIKYINGIEPFKFIQDFANQYIYVKNKHAAFTFMIDYFHFFPFELIPLTKEELTDIEFTFTDGETLKLNYTVYSQKDFENDFLNFNQISNMLNGGNDRDEIKWDYSTKDKLGFQCRIDNNNKVNVFKQSSFMYSDDFDAVVKKCFEEFYSNSFPIIGIESKNPGGLYLFPLVQQLTQLKILQRQHISIKLTEFMDRVIPKNSFLDIETCEPIQEFKNITDDYGNGIKHHRTQVFSIMNLVFLKELEKTRKRLYEKNNFKKPTEIIIFTDFRSFSAASFLIKGFQETGGAIIVGYRGNPKLKGEPLDASISPSGSLNFIDQTEIGQTLNECGFYFQFLTNMETFNYSYQGPNPIPREYQINPVDERVNIYQAYDDSLYDDFIKEAKKIFKKYNEDQECNPDNELLLFEPDNNSCYNFENIPHAHGGYQCDKGTKKWNTTCKPFYCDIGYYFDTYQNKCIEDLCNKPEKEEDKGNIGTYMNGSSFFLQVLFLITLWFI